MKQVAVHCDNAKGSQMVDCVATFRHVIDGKTFTFHVTKSVNNVFGYTITEARTGLRVRELGALARYLSPYSKLRTDDYKAQAKMILDDLIKVAGAAKVREVMEKAPTLTKDSAA